MHEQRPISPLRHMFSWDYLPTSAAVSYQSFQIYLWAWSQVPPALQAAGWTNPAAVAAWLSCVCAGLSLEFLYIASIVYAEHRHPTRAVWLTVLVTMLGSVAISVSYHWEEQGVRALLHAVFPIGAAAFSIQLYLSRLAAQPVAADAQEVEQLRTELVQETARANSLHVQLGEQTGRAEAAERRVREHEQVAHRREQALADAQTLIEQLRSRPATAADVLAHWQRLQTEQSLSARKAADVVGVGESTLRNWAASRNGHLREEVHP